MDWELSSGNLISKFKIYISRALPLSVDRIQCMGTQTRIFPAQCKMDKIYRRKNMGTWSIKQVSDRKCDAKSG